MNQTPYSKEHCYVYNFKEGIDGNIERSKDLVNITVDSFLEIINITMVGIVLLRKKIKAGDI